MLQNPVRAVVGVVLASLLAVVPTFGQGAIAEINGNAVDQSGAVLPGVTVTLTEETTGLVRTVVSNDTGRFTVQALQPGRYTMRAELQGFQTQAMTGVTVNVGQALTINFTLPIGGLQDQITVTGEAPLIEVTQTEIGATSRRRPSTTCRPRAANSTPCWRWCPG